MSQDMNFGEKLKKLRKDKGLTQKEVADACDISVRTYIAYEQRNIRPRNRETYYKLAKILGSDVNSLILEDIGAVGIGSAVAVASLVPPFMIPIVGLPLAMGITLGTNLRKNHNLEDNNSDDKTTIHDDMLLSYEKYQKKFKSTATGIIMTTLAFKGIQCQLGRVEDLSLNGSKPDLLLLLNNHEIQNWWFCFWSKDNEKDDYKIVTPMDLANILICRFTGIPSDSTRKVSIVVGDEELFNAICYFKDNNSYRGNLSVILIDLDESKVSKEEIISTYYDDNNFADTLLGN